MEAQLKEDTAWARAGYAVAKGQFITGSRESLLTEKREGSSLKVTENFGALIITGSDFEYRFPNEAETSTASAEAERNT